MPREIFRCGLGTTSVGISANGNLYSCQEQVTNDENIFYIGNIYNGIDSDLHIKLLNNYRQISQTISEKENFC